MRNFKLIIPLFLFLSLAGLKSAWAVTEFVSNICANNCTASADYTSLSTWNATMACDLTAATGTTKVFTGTMTGTLGDATSVALYRGGASQSITAMVVHYNGSLLLVKSISSASFSFAAGDKWWVDSSHYFTISSTGDPAIATAQINGTWPSTGDPGGAVSISSSVGWVTSSANYIKIYTGAGAMAPGNWTTSASGPYSLQVTNGTYALQISGVNNVQVTGLQIGLTNNNTTGYAVSITGLTGSTPAITLQKNIISGAISSTGAGGGIYSADNDISAQINLYNNIVYNFANGSASFGIKVGGSSGGTYNIYNNTCYGNYYGIIRAAGTANLANNLCISNTTGGDYSGTFNSSETDISSDTTSPDGSTYKSMSVAGLFVNAGSDFHLASTAPSLAQTGGTDLSATFPDDVQGIMRGSGSLVWSIGASQYGDIWYGTTSSAWGTAANWSAGIPGATSVVIFESAYNNACNMPSVSIGSINILSGYTQTLTPSLTVDPVRVFRGRRYV